MKMQWEAKRKGSGKSSGRSRKGCGKSSGDAEKAMEMQ